MGNCLSNSQSAAPRPPAQAPASVPATTKKMSTPFAVSVVHKGKERFKNIAMAPVKIDEDYTFPQFPKTSEERDLLSSAVSSNFIFSETSPSQREQLLDAFEKYKVGKGSNIITEGETGDFFYIIQSGSVTFTKQGVEVGKAGPGMSFGDLALLYDSPRAATCLAMEACTLWRVDQRTFHQILANSSVSADKDTMKILRKVEFLSNLSDEYIAKIASAVTPQNFKKGETIIQKGDLGTVFYILKSGSVIVKDIDSGVSSSQSKIGYDNMVLKPGDFFGERAILKEEPRNATIVALEDSCALTLSHSSFLDMIGPISDLLKITEDVRQLKSIPAVSKAGLSDLELSELASRITKVTLKSNQYVYKENEEVSVNGDSKPSLYLVRSGEIKVISKVNPDLNRVCGPGSYFGQTFLLSTDKVVTACATTDTELGRLKTQDIEIVVRNMSRFDPNKVHMSMVKKRDIALKDLTKHRVLGQGGFGVVWLVSTKNEDKTQAYALKIQMKKQLLDSTQIEGTIREIKIMSELDHPFVLPLINLYQDDSSIMMLLPLVQGGELLELITKAKGGRLSEKAAKFYAAGILEGLHYMHIRSIAHRDMKPENVLISKDGFPIIVDLGFAKEIKDKSFTLCGSPLYIAPENILGKGHDPSCDYWSWACMIQEMLTGATPFEKSATDQSSLFKAIIKHRYVLAGPPIAVQLVRKVLVRPQQRLGNLAGGTKDLKEHAWFKNDVDFVKLAKMDSGVPWKPKVEDPLDAAEFDQYVDTGGRSEPLTKREQEKFTELDNLYAKLKQEDRRAPFQNWLSQRSL